MDQPRNGRGALNLLLRLTMLRARQRGGGSLAEQGYALVVALIAAFVLLLGVAALASRGQLSFIGQVFQVQNRQARDVAETAIADFANTMNREPNRLILMSGTRADQNYQTDWETSVNICTAYNKAGTPSTSGGSPLTTAPTAAEIGRFLPGTTTNLGNGRSFTVQSVDYRLPDRNPYDRDDTFTDDAGVVRNLRESLLSGRTRTLIRITVIGNVAQNNRTSSARVSREFEIVPKCCKRSFGRNTDGGDNNWGRDERDCFGGGPEGFLVGLGGALKCNGAPTCGIQGVGRLQDIVGEDNTPIRRISCLLNESPECVPPGYSIGNNSNFQISVVPTPGPLTPFPTYSNPNGTVTPAQVNFSSRTIIYFDPARVTATDSGLVRQGLTSTYQLTGTPTRLNGVALGTTTSIDPCYRDTEFNMSSSKDPYTVVHCRAQNFNISNNTEVVIDTSASKINLFFDPSTYSGDYISFSGSAAVIRTHNFRDSAGFSAQGQNCLAQTGATLASCRIQWVDVPPGDPVTDADREGTFLELCSYRLAGCDDEKYAVRRLLNIYASGTGTFDYRGNGTAEGYNIYAPDGGVLFRGTTNFMGQVWTNKFYLNGTSGMRTFGSGSPATGFGVPLIDFIARSFTQSSGF
ncbi:MAG: hypothetical protein WBN89_07545 [Prochlorococcaceae cyanobacterium]